MSRQDRLNQLREMADNKKHFDQMITFFGKSKTLEGLSVLVLMYLMDTNILRSDILCAEKYTRILKGWK